MWITQDERGKGIYTSAMQLSSYDITQFLISLAALLPFLLIDLAGIVLSVVFRKRMGKAWLFSLAGFLLLICGNFLHIGFQVWLHMFGGFRGEDLATAFRVNWFVQTFFNVFGMISILIAMFVGRTAAENKEMN